MNIVKPRINLAAVRNLAHLGPFYEPAYSLSATGDADENWEISDAPSPLGVSERQAITDRLQGAIIFAVKQELDEEVATAGAIDLVACRAFAFANGPVEMMRDLGADAVNTLISSVTANVNVSNLINIMLVIRILSVAAAHSILGCDKSPILLESKENKDGPYRARFA